MRLTALYTTIFSLLIVIAPVTATAQDGANINREKLMNPAQLTETAPDTFQVKFDTSKGEFIVEVTRDWAPNGADRFYNLVKNGYYNDCRFFRVVENFMVQFGINGDPQINSVINRARIKDDPRKQSNTRGFITYAMAGPDTRTTQLFINYANNSFLDNQGFSPFGRVTSGMDVVDAINNKYGETPNQQLVQTQGNAYLKKEFPNLDYIKTATIIE
jgi:peptidyl-prolyl cis-trans isomerase A (cyclophilin A)